MKTFFLSTNETGPNAEQTNEVAFFLHGSECAGVETLLSLTHNMITLARAGRYEASAKELRSYLETHLDNEDQSALEAISEMASALFKTYNDEEVSELTPA
jgi:cellobiose phosphorylase